MTTDPSTLQSIGWVVMIAFGAAGGLNQVLRLLDRTKLKPDPASTYQTKDDASRAEASMHKRIDDIEARIQEASVAREAGTASLRSEMDRLRADFRADLTRLHERMDEMDQRFNSRIDGLPERVIATLRNTGAIKT